MRRFIQLSFRLARCPSSNCNIKRYQLLETTIGMHQIDRRTATLWSDLNAGFGR
jgi:hypothetical protein